jgi:hypothetical protein
MNIYRDFSTPSSRLVGHWKIVPNKKTKTQVEYFFSAINQDAGVIGQMIQCNHTINKPSKDKEYFAYYVIKKEDTHGTSLLIEAAWSPTMISILSFEVDKDGKTGTLSMPEISSRKGPIMIYVDNKTRPEK